MKYVMKALEFIMKNTDQIIKFILKFVGKKQQELESDKRQD